MLLCEKLILLTTDQEVGSSSLPGRAILLSAISPSFISISSRYHFHLESVKKTFNFVQVPENKHKFAKIERHRCPESAPCS